MNFVLCCMFVFLVFIAYLRTRSINIAVVQCAIWAFLTVFVCILDLPRSAGAFFFVLINQILFLLSYLIIQNRQNNTNPFSMENDSAFQKNIAVFEKINIIVLVLNIVSLIYLSIAFGFNLSTFTSVSSLMAKMNSISHLRYAEGEADLPIFCRLCNLFVYSTCAYCGFFIMKGRLKLVYFLNIIIVFLQTILTNTKATLVFGLAFFGGGLLTGYSFFGRKIKAKYFFVVLIGFILMVLFNSFINYFRHAGYIDFFSEIEKIIVAYFIGPYSAFTLWFDKSAITSLDLGANTFSSIFKLFEISPHMHGEFMDVGGIPTNVYTIYKHLINDFSMIGTCIISVFCGLLSAIAECNIYNKNYAYVGLSIVILSTMLVTFFSSLFRYNVNFFACVIIIIASLPIVNVKHGER